MAVAAVNANWARPWGLGGVLQARYVDQDGGPVVEAGQSIGVVAAPSGAHGPVDPEGLRDQLGHAMADQQIA